MKYRLVIFDWQGTLADVRGQFIQHFQYVAGNLGLDVRDATQISEQMVFELCDMVQHLYPKLEVRRLTNLMELFQDYHLSHLHDVCLYSDAITTLKFIVEQQAFVAIATSASRVSLERELTYTDLTKYIDAFRTPDQTLMKPAPDMLLELMEQFACQADETLMVGDSSCDFEAAQHAGVDFVGVHISDPVLIEQIEQANHCVLPNLNALTALL